MGSNYYYRYNICEKCGRFDSLHLGKHSMGWEFLFRGYRYDKDGDPIIIIESWEDWSVFIASNKGKIHNNYGDPIMLEDFLLMIITSQHMKRRKKRSKTDNFQDNKGYWFCMKEFD